MSVIKSHSGLLEVFSHTRAFHLPSLLPVQVSLCFLYYLTSSSELPKRRLLTSSFSSSPFCFLIKAQMQWFPFLPQFPVQDLPVPPLPRFTGHLVCMTIWVCGTMDIHSKLCLSLALVRVNDPVNLVLTP